MKSKWDDLTVADQLRIKEISELQMATEDEKNMMVAAMLAEIPYEEILRKPLGDVREIMDNTEFLLHKPQAVKARKKYVINGRTYKLFKDPSEMTVAQYFDFQAVHKEGYEKMPGEMLCIFLVPEGHEYNDGYDKDQQLDDMLSLSVTEALGIVDFFTGRCLKSIRRMAMFCKVMLKLEILKAPKQEKEALKALELQMRLIMDGLMDEYSLLASKL